MPAEIQTEINQTETGEERIERLLQENLEYNKAIYEMCRKTKRYILVMQILTWIQVLAIVVPLIFAVIYLPPLIKNMIGPYQELLGNGSGGSIIDQLKEMQSAGGLQDLLK